MIRANDPMLEQANCIEAHIDYALQNGGLGEYIMAPPSREYLEQMLQRVSEQCSLRMMSVPELRKISEDIRKRLETLNDCER